jgi:hypothetical protein
VRGVEIVSPTRGIAHVAQVGDEVADLAGLRARSPLAQLQVAHFVHVVHVVGMRAEAICMPCAHAVHDPDAGIAPR